MALNQVLVDYIQNQLRKGFSLDYIKEFLLSQGYNPSEINDAISAITKDRIASIRSYIKQEENKGSDIASIRSNLVSYGYTESEVNEAMRSAPGKFPGWAVLAVLVAFIIIGGLLYFISRPSTEIINVPQAPVSPVSGPEAGQPAEAETTPGSPSVTEEETEPVQETEFIRAERKYDVINASTDEKIMKAVQMCENTPNEIYKDACFDQLSKATRDHSLCSKIIDSVQKDSCFRRTAIYTMNPEICKEISDPQIRSECQLYEYV